MNQPSIYFSKTTEELHHEIESSSNIEDYLTENKKNMHLDTLSRHLNRLLAQKNLTKADVVRDSLLDRTYLYRVFKEINGITIQQYITSLRLKRACHFLISSSLSFSEIAYYCGYSSEQYFSMAFKKHMGIAPSAYRKSRDPNAKG